MNTSLLYRSSAMALIGSFVASLIGGVLHPVIDGQAHSAAVFLAPASPWAQYGIYLGALLLMFGLPGGYLWFRERIGILGLLGFSLYFLGNAVSAQAHLVVEAFVAPVLAADPQGIQFISDRGEIFDGSAFAALQLVGGLVFVAGLLVSGIAVVLARGVPTWIGLVLIVGALLAFAPIPEMPVIAGVLIEVPRGLAFSALAVLLLRELRDRRSSTNPSVGSATAVAR